MSVKYAIHPDYQNLHNDILRIEAYFSASSESIHKARNELRIATVGDERMVIKAFKIPHLLNRFVYAFLRDSKAKKSYDNAIKLHALGVSTPSPVAYMEFYTFCLLSQSYYIALLEPSDFTIRTALHHKTEDYRDILGAFAKFTWELHKKGIWHADYTPGNILVTRGDDRYRFSLVDINRMEFRPVTPEEGTRAFGKLWAREEDLLLMADAYAGASGLDAKTAYRLMAQHAVTVVKNKAIKNRLKGKA